MASPNSASEPTLEIHLQKMPRLVFIVQEHTACLMKMAVDKKNHMVEVDNVV